MYLGMRLYERREGPDDHNGEKYKNKHKKHEEQK